MRLEDFMGRIADVLAELGSLGAVKDSEAPARTLEPAKENSEAREEADEYDPVALLTEGFRSDTDPETEAVEADEGEDEDALDEEEAEEAEESQESGDEDEDGEDEEQDAAEGSEIDLAPVVSKLLKSVESMAEQMNSLLRAMRELDALLK